MTNLKSSLLSTCRPTRRFSRARAAHFLHLLSWPFPRRLNAGVRRLLAICYHDYRAIHNQGGSMPNRTSYRVLLTAPYISDTYKDWSEGREWQYEIAPNSQVKKGDIVYLWRVSDNDLYGWGEIVETPRINEH